MLFPPRHVSLCNAHAASGRAWSGCSPGPICARAQGGCGCQAAACTGCSCRTPSTWSSSTAPGSCSRSPPTSSPGACASVAARTRRWSCAQARPRSTASRRARSSTRASSAESAAMNKTRHQHGASLVEAVIVLPLLLFIVLALMQAALLFHAKSNLNYATHEAARAATVNHASLASIHAALQKALVAYHGGGRTAGELQSSFTRAGTDIEAASRVEILSPTPESFRDYGSPQLQAALGSEEPVIPNV